MEVSPKYLEYLRVSYFPKIFSSGFPRRFCPLPFAVPPPPQIHLSTATMKLLLASLLASATAFSPAINTPQQSFSATRLEARKPFISGNWKLNPSTKDEALTLGKEIAASITADTPDVDVALFVPYVFIESTMGVVGDKLSIGAEVRSYC